MKIFAVSPEVMDQAEARVIGQLLDAGLDVYHLRKPGASLHELASFIALLPETDCSRIVLHQHYELVDAYGLAGFHLKDTVHVDSECREITKSASVGKTFSCSIHRLERLDAVAGLWDYVFLSPIFQSISKARYAPSWSVNELTDVLKQCHSKTNAEIYALGGIDSRRAVEAKQIGFDGVVLHGVLWEVSDALQAFNVIRKAVQ